MKKSFILFLCIIFLMKTITVFSSETGNPLAQTMSALSYDEQEKFIFDINDDWHGEYDVIVVGYGGAGATASIAAAEEGAKVLLLEKAPKGEEGGNTKYASQFILSLEVENIEPATTYFEHIRGKYNTPNDEMINSYLESCSGNYDWLMSIGAKYISVFPFHEYDFPGGEAMQTMIIDGEPWTSSLYRTLQEAVEERRDSIDVWYESPAIELIQDPETKIIHGVKVDNNGTILNIRAKSGVVLCTGGFENNQQMIQDYLQLPYGYSKAAANKDDVYSKSVMDGKPPIVATWKEPEEITLQYGEFLGEDRGIGGPMKVKVTMNGDKIIAVEVVYHSETRGVSSNAIEKITNAIIKEQYPDVDTVTGATVTSKGIINAVKNALEKVGKND